MLFSLLGFVNLSKLCRSSLLNILLRFIKKCRQNVDTFKDKINYSDENKLYNEKLKKVSKVIFSLRFVTLSKCVDPLY